MMKKTLIAALVPLVLIVSNSAFAEDPITVNGGTVKFTGSIVNAPCAVDTSAAGHTVELGQYRVADFSTTGDTTQAKSFNIGLSNCAVDTYTKAAVSFTGNTPAGNSSALAVEGGAGGVAIQILKDGVVLAMDGSEPSTTANLLEGSNSLPFQAQFISLAANVTPGAANATADFTITYQ